MLINSQSKSLPGKTLSFCFKNWLSDGFFGETRTRIIIWYTILTGSCLGLSIPLFTHLVIWQVDQRVAEDLQEEIQNFRDCVNNKVLVEKQTDAKKIFDHFLYEQYPADKTFLIATIQGEFYRSSPLRLPKSVSRTSPLTRELSQTTEPIEGHIIDHKKRDILYYTEPLIIDGKVKGVLIIANILAVERQEALDTFFIVIIALFVLVVFALILAWFISGRLLRPIQSLIKTAHSISETDLSKRISESGGGEIASLAKTFNQMMDRLEKGFIAHRQLVNDVSHKLRTPIAIIQGNLESLDYYTPEEQPEIIKLALEELIVITRLVEDLLLLARAENKDFFILETVELAEFTEAIYHKIQGLGKRNWRLDALGTGKIHVDPQRLTQAIINLVHNAIQHTQENDIIAIGSCIDNTSNKPEFRFWVRDTGVGIPKADQHRIFQRFERAENSQSSSEGTGLGLSIVTAIAESHAGSVELYSQLGEGATFTLVLPMKKSRNQSDSSKTLRNSRLDHGD
ncbi:MAG: HAMP domain-containing sensor histidine kinase [Limnoraphis robusta]|uniref:sensor histidine kinase n=1 Tax=Limnoraphis robusta TaxID=1118279 RepID=UPI002B2008E5|nr:HAMP domain-containing sensor histidine kinase [Limnoraphis robusta]MEA5542838.1 HAMP domain-containing sensor histidine kinase [Limnoraphis robusta Tam1]